MSWKAFIFIIVIILLGIFAYLKLEIMGNPNSGFNQTTRFSLGRRAWVRTILGLHNAGDARGEIFSNSGPIIIEWFKPESDEVDAGVLTNFAAAVTKSTGRPAQVSYGGAISDGNLALVSLSSFQLKASLQAPAGASVIPLFFTEDYSPRQPQEHSTTYGELGIVVSLKAHRDFLQIEPNNLNQYLFSSSLREFGYQLGLKSNQDPDCVMNDPTGFNGQPFEAFGRTDPQDFCSAEQTQINQLKLQY